MLNYRILEKIPAALILYGLHGTWIRPHRYNDLCRKYTNIWSPLMQVSLTQHCNEHFVTNSFREELIKLFSGSSAAKYRMQLIII